MTENPSEMNALYIGASSFTTMILYFVLKLITRKYCRSSCYGIELELAQSMRNLRRRSTEEQIEEEEKESEQV